MRVIVRRRRAALPMILCLITALSAQEAETGREPAWQAETALALAMARGNTDTTSFSLTVDTSGRLRDRLVWTNKAFFLMSRQSGDTIAESLGAVSRLRWDLTDRVFTFLELNGLRDQFKNWAFRFIPSAGAGIVVLKRESMNLALDAGLSGVFTEYSDSGASDSFVGLTLGDQWSWAISEGAEIKQGLSFNSDVSDLNRYFFHFEISLTSRLSRNWSVQLKMIDVYDNQPVGEGIEKNDLALLAGFSMKF
jgi:putative salt-induced outer membrane protein YdiY